jgi:hypothetical protein
MNPARLAPLWVGLVGTACLTLVSGCGRSDADPAAKSGQLPTASVGENDAEQPVPAAPVADTVEWALHEIELVRLKPLPEDSDLGVLAAFQRQRNREIVGFAEHAVARSHSDPTKAELYAQAVHHLMEARLQLALQEKHVSEAEHRADVQALYENAEVLFRGNPQSAAAAEAGFVLVKFAEIMAHRSGGEDDRWLDEYARQAQLFARNFPHEDERAVAKLDAAGWSCEAHGRTEPAVACYQALQQRFPKHPQAAHVPAVLRRLSLQGKELRLAGPTLDGGYFTLDDRLGQVTLVAFWASETMGVEEQVPVVKELAKRYGDKGFSVVAVSLDPEEAAVHEFRQRHGVDWPIVFHADPKQRHWNNPLVKYYGIRNIPTYWLVGRDGKVVSTQVDLTNLDSQLAKLLGGKS